MKCRIVAIFCILAAGCEGKPRSFAGPDPGDDGTPATYTLTGAIRDSDGNSIAGAQLRLDSQASTRTGTSDTNGAYRFDNVRGRTVLWVSKAEYENAASYLWVGRDETVDVVLDRMVVLAGVTLRGTVKNPPCDPVGWDANALCQRVFWTPTVTGEYELVLTWDGTYELDLMLDGSLYWAVTDNPRQIRARIVAQAGVKREIRIHSYYGPQPFELSATLRAAP